MIVQGVITLWICFMVSVIFMVIVVETTICAISYVAKMYRLRVEKDLLMKHMDNPVVMVNDRGEEFWVGYHKD